MGTPWGELPEQDLSTPSHRSAPLGPKLQFIPSAAARMVVNPQASPSLELTAHCTASAAAQSLPCPSYLPWRRSSARQMCFRTPILSRSGRAPPRFTSPHLDPRAIRRRTDVDIRLDPHRAFVAACNQIGKYFSMSCFHQIQSPSPKSASGHPPAVIARQPFSSL